MSHTVQLRLSVEAVLIPHSAVAGTTQETPGQALTTEAAPAHLAVNAGTQQVQSVEHKLEVSYTLPSGEAVIAPPALSPVNPDVAATAAVHTSAFVTGAPQRLHWSASSTLSVDEALVRSIAASNAAMPLTLSCASRMPAAADSPPAANAAATAKAAKPGKAAAAAVPEEVPWQPGPQQIVPFDLAPLLIGQTEVSLALPRKGLLMPAPLQAFSRIRIKLQVCTAPPAPPQLSPGEAKAAAAKAKADPKAAAAAAAAAAAEAAMAVGTAPAEPCQLLTPALAAQLSPVIITPCKATRLPCAPATLEQLDTLCHPCSVSYKLPLQPTINRSAAQVTGWKDGTTTDGAATVLRKMLLTGSTVLLAGDLNVDDFLLACAEQPVIFEVHDRDAKPQPQGFVPAAPKPLPAAPLKGKAGKAVVKTPAATLKKSLTASSKSAIPAAVDASEPAAPTELPSEYVCGIAKCSLAGLAKGAKRLELTANVMPFTSVRGAAGLEWNSRPGSYMEAGTTFKVTVCTAVPLTETLALQQAALARPYSRVVFIMDYADSPLLHSIEEAVRSQNVRCLGLHKTPAGTVSRNRAASVYGGASRAAGSTMHSSAASASSADDTEPFELTIPMLQSLSTYKMTSQQATDDSLDLLTGFQLVDGKERIIAVEGLAGGAMQAVQDIALHSLDGTLPQPPNTRLRAVHWHQGIRYKSRLYAELGLNLWIVKLCQPLPAIEAQAASYATGKVRQECVEGLKKVVALRRVEWARQVASLNLLPTSSQLTLLDKKFGGELTQQDVHGVEEPPLAVPSSRSLKNGTSFRSFRSKAQSVQSGDDAQSQQDLEEGEFSCRVDCWNGAYQETRAADAAVREGQDWIAHNQELLHQLQASRHGLRDNWATWNPQRQASHQLQQQVLAGEISLQDTVDAQRLASSSSGWQHEVVPGTIPAADARARGWYQHAAPFEWPAAKDAQAFITHPQKPSQARCDELAEPWHDSHTPQAEDKGNEFKVIMPAPGLFGRDAAYWQSVHQCGEGLEKEKQDAAKKAKEAWQAKVIVANINMHTALPQRHKPSQLDRMEPLLKDKPQKLGFKIVASPPAPYSMFTGDQNSTQE